MEMRNTHEEGSSLWELFEAGEKLGNLAATDDKQVDAIDRMTVAFYRIGAEFISSIDNMSLQIAHLTEEVSELKRKD